MVPGCRNQDSLMIHRTREPWPNVIICEECIKDAFYALCPDQIDEAAQESEEADAENAEGVVDDAQEGTETDAEAVQEDAEVAEECAENAQDDAETDAEAVQEGKTVEESAKVDAKIKETSGAKPKKPSSKKADGK